MALLMRVTVALLIGFGAGVYVDKNYEMPNVKEKRKELMALYESYKKK